MTEYEQAAQDLADVIERLFTGWFQCGTDTLGPDGYGILAGALNCIRDALWHVAERFDLQQMQSEVLERKRRESVT